MQAAFVNFGRDRHGFLAFNDIQSDYYQLPSEDKEKIRIAEEKIREDLKNKAVETSEENNEINNNVGQVDQKNFEETNNNQIDESEKLDNNKISKDNETQKKNYRDEVKSKFGIKRYRIQEVIKPGQVILVQVIKEERGQKGAALTTFYFFGWEVHGSYAKYSKRRRNIKKDF